MMSQRTYESNRVFVTTRLASLAYDGSIATDYFQWQDLYKPTRDLIDETRGFIPAQAWCLLRDGVLALAPYRDQYRIEFYCPSGSLLRTISRDFKSPRRTEEDLKAIKEIKKKVVNGREVPLRFVLEESDPAVVSIQTLDNGNIWIASSMHTRDLPPGASARYDVYTPAGAYLEQTLLFFENDHKNDRFLLLSDGSVLQIKNYFGLNMSAIGVPRAIEGSEEDRTWKIVHWCDKQ